MATADEGEITENTVEFARIHARLELWVAVIRGASSALTVASFGVPLYCVYLTVGVLAGKNTQVSPAVAYTVAGMVGGTSALAVLVGGWVKRSAQTKELVRLRGRVTQLEERLRRKGRGTRS